MPKKINWLEEPEDKDYAAARSYLSLIVPPETLDDLIARFAQAPNGHWRAKDILRAAQLPLLTAKKSGEVVEKLAHIKAGIAISPILLVCLRDEIVLQIADGYHRTCAAYLTDEDTVVPGRILFPA
ncbi:MAG: hypothetical protein ABSC56_01140 [Solirubrobacteraceae bacterium]|jgi:hypothetical protein